MATTTRRPVKLSFTKKRYEEDAFNATKEAFEVISENQNDQFASLHLKLENLTVKVASLSEAMPTKKAPAKKKKTEETPVYDKNSLGYCLGRTTGNIRAAQHPVVAGHLACKGIGGFVAAFKQGWRDQQMAYDEMVETLEARRAAREEEAEAVTA